MNRIPSNLSSCSPFTGDILRVCLVKSFYLCISFRCFDFTGWWSFKLMLPLSLTRALSSLLISMDLFLKTQCKVTWFLGTHYNEVFSTRLYFFEYDDVTRKLFHCWLNVSVNVNRRFVFQPLSQTMHLISIVREPTVYYIRSPIVHIFLFDTPKVNSIQTCLTNKFLWVVLHI